MNSLERKRSGGHGRFIVVDSDSVSCLSRTEHRAGVANAFSLWFTGFDRAILHKMTDHHLLSIFWCSVQIHFMRDLLLIENSFSCKIPRLIKPQHVYKQTQPRSHFEGWFRQLLHPSSPNDCAFHTQAWIQQRHLEDAQPSSSINCRPLPRSFQSPHYY